MADNSVVFTVSANTKPASQAITDLQKELKNIGNIKSVDKKTVAQQRELKKVAEGVSQAYEKQQKVYQQYGANTKKIEQKTAELQKEEEFTKKLTEQYNELLAQQAKGTITPEGVNTLSRLSETIPHRLEKEEKLRSQINTLVEKNAKLDEYSEQVLQHIFGDEKEIVKDESTILGYRVQQRAATQDAASAESELKDTSQQTNSVMAETATNAKKMGDALKDTANAANKLEGQRVDLDAKDEKEDLLELRATLIALKADVSTIGDKMRLDPANDNVAELVRRYQELGRAKRTIERMGMPEDADGTYKTILRLMTQLNAEINAYKKNLRGASDAQKEMAKSGEHLKALPDAVKAINSGFKSLSRSSHKLRSAFAGMSRDMRSHFKHLITGITKYVLGFRSLFFLVRRLRRYLGEGIKNLAQFNDGNNIVNESITDLLSSLLYLKNAWAAAFSPIITAVRPYLVALLDDLAAVGNTIARFLSALFGQEVAFNAVRVRAADYADSLDKVGDSAGSAADKTKKLTDRLAAFDDLNVLGVDNDPNSTGSGGGGGLADAYTPDPNEMFKIVDPERNGFLSALKNAWETANFRGVGIIIRKKLLELLDIDWENAQEKAKQIGSAIGQFLNGLFGSPEFWEAIGTGLGESFNTITYGIQSFLEATSGVDFGGSIAKGLNEFFRTTDFETMGQNVNEIFTQLTDNINSFVDNLDSDELANKLTEFIEGLDIGDIIAKANECLLKVASLVLEVTGKVIVNEGEKLGEKWWNEVTEGIDTKIGKIPVTLEPTIDATEHPVQALIDNWLTKIGENVMKTPLSIGSLTAKSMGIDADEVDVINMVSERWEEFWSDFEDGCNTVKDTMSDSSTSLINSMDAIMPKITELKDVVTSSWEKIKTDTEEKWAIFKTTITNKATEIKSSVTQKINDLRDALSSKWQEIKDAAWTKFTLLRVAIVDIFTQLKDAVKTPINGFIGVIESMVNKVITGVNKVIDALNTLPDIKFTNPFTGAEYALGFTLPKLSQITIPRLAQGAVIPPNREFMAVLGDQSHGTNIEAPLDVIKQAVAEVLANNGNAEVIQLLQQLIAVVESKNLTIGDKEIGKANARYVSQQQIVRGTGW